MPLRIGKLIRQRRKELHMTQKELAEKMGFEDTGSISKYELGQVLPPIDILVKIADALDTTVAYFVDEISEKTSGLVKEIVGTVNCANYENQKKALEIIKILCA